jgi:gliding motility-associated-like protein
MVGIHIQKQLLGTKMHLIKEYNKVIEMVLTSRFGYVLGMVLCTFVTFAQTFNGQGGLPFPTSGTQGIAQSPAIVSGVGILDDCTYIDNVTIDLEHTWTGDIAIMLISPLGLLLELSSQNGGPGDNYTNTVFTDSAPLNIVSGAPPFTGSFNAEGRQNTNLFGPYPNTSPPGTFTFQNTFDGINADGQWVLYLFDLVAGDVGFLNSWSITFVNNGTSFTVDLGQDLVVCEGDDFTLTANNTAPNPSYVWQTGSVSPSLNVVDITTTGTYSVTVTDASGCTATDDVLVTVQPSPTANPVTYELCGDANGFADFNLNSITNAIGGGLPVTFYTDFTLTTQIVNLNPYNSFSTTIYASTTLGACPSGPIPITLIVTPSDPSAFGMNIIQETLCGMGLIQVQFTLPSPGLYTYNYELNCSNGNDVGSFTTMANPFNFAITSDCTLLITSIENETTGCITTFDPPLTDNVVVIDEPDITTTNVEICAGETLDLLGYASTIPGATLTFHTSSPPTAGNQLASTTVSPSITTTYVVLSNLSSCTNQAQVIVTVNPGGIPFTSSLNTCENAGLINLTPFVTPPSLTGAWSGQGVTGSNFDPTGLSGAILLTFTPTNNCYDPGTLTVTVTPDQVLFLLDAEICKSTSPLDLNTLEDPNVTNGTWSGTAVSGGFFDPSLAPVGINTVSFTPTNACISSASTTIEVLPVPDVTLVDNITVCQGAQVNLNDYILNPLGLDVQIYFNLPAESFNEVLNPIVTINMLTQFFVKFTDANGCFNIAPLQIDVSLGGTPILGTDLLCQSLISFDLNLLNDPSVGPGTWSGSGVVNNIIDLTTQDGIIPLTFTPDGSCFDIGTTIVEIIVPQTPVLGTDDICSGSGGFDLFLLSDPNYTTGTWVGSGVTNNVFDPTNFSGTVTFTFFSNEFCVNAATTQLNVIPSQVPTLLPLTICQTVDMVDLNTLEDPTFSNGVWSGQGVNGDVFNTLGLVGPIDLLFTSSDICVEPSTTTIDILLEALPQIQSFTICESDAPVSLSAYVDPDYPLGTWSGVGVTNGFFDPDGLSNVVSLIFTSTADCTLPAAMLVTVKENPNIDNFVITCDDVTSTYIVQFDISGGEPGTYLVNGNPSPSTFVSGSFPSNTNYTFEIIDANQCDVITLQGSKNCACANSSGTMDFTDSPLVTCASEIVTASYNSDGILEDNNRLVFMLHDNAGTVLGNIFATSSQPVFSFPSNGVLGTTYYISAVSGDTTLQGNIDFTDACFSVSAGVPVVFYEPQIQIIPVNDICVSSCTDVGFALSGQGPYQVVTSILFNNTVIKKDTINVNNNYLMTFCPADFNNLAGVVTIKIEQFTDQNCVGKGIDSTISFTVFPERISTVNSQLCQGESIVINGNTYNEVNSTGTEIVLSQVSGQCDSIININLNFIPEVSSSLTQQLCNTQSLIVNGTTYDVNNPIGIEIIIGGSQAGCDSTVVVNLTFTDEIIENLNPTLCDGEFLIVNGTRYDVNNPTGTENIPSTDGIRCDSLINIQLNFESPKINNINQTLCAGESIQINGNTYESTNPSDQLILANQASNGCDSIININLSFLPPSFFIIEDTLCVEQNFVFDGVVYDVNNPSASYIIQNSNGCDSTINIQFYFFAAEIDTVELSLKMGESVTYNGVVFDENKKEGITTNPSSSANGCLRYTYVSLRFEEAFITATYVVVPESCPGENDGKILINDIQGCSNYVVTLQDSVINNPVFPIVIEDLAPGNYTLDIKGDVACVFTQNITINGSLSQGFVIDETMFDVLEGETITLNLGLSPEPEAIVWTPSTYLSCDDCLAPILADTAQSIVYEIQLTDDIGCLYTSRVEVRVNEVIKDIVLPNIFSPNGDGQNDRWDINVTNQIVRQVSVYDRWGNQVFGIKPSIDQNLISWDGKKDGQNVLPGVYVYLIQYVDAGGKAVAKGGDVTVIR